MAEDVLNVDYININITPLDGAIIGVTARVDFNPYALDHEKRKIFRMIGEHLRKLGVNGSIELCYSNEKPNIYVRL